MSLLVPARYLGTPERHLRRIVGRSPVVTVDEMQKLIAGALAGLYCVLVARLTLATPSQGQWAFSFADSLASHASQGELTWAQTEVIANVALFVPLGFLLTLAIGRAGIAVVVCVLLSAAIEYAQLRYLPSRVPSVADVEHNSFGAVLGALVGHAVNLAWPGVAGASEQVSGSGGPPTDWRDAGPLGLTGDRPATMCPCVCSSPRTSSPGP